jgi:VIT1/CCC1 family predicted Fe2+/Mn2+ transporter
MEQKHYNFWMKYVPQRRITVDRVKLYLTLLLRVLLGTTFAVRYLERHEMKTIKTYKSISNLIPIEDRKEFDEMVEEEESHEKSLESRIEGASVRYISFIVLGLADAVVEIAGIHAGTLGIYDSTRLAGLAGIIAGAAASLAMASAAYAQAKQGFSGSASVSATYTGVSYFGAAVILASPYFATQVMATALTTSLTFAVLLIAFIIFYSSVIASKPFRRDFFEIVAIMFGATAALYILGTVIHFAFGITI